MLIGNVDSLIWNHEDSTSSMVDEYNFNNRYVHSFLIGEIPVTANLGYVVFEGYLPKENRKSLLAGLVPVQPFFDKETVQFFIDTLNARTGRHFRLPTNEEWEFAARGGMKSKGYKYSGSDNLNNIAWYKGNCKEAHSVRKKVPNELGIYDMSGNYWECTSTPLYKAKQFMRMTYESLDLEDEDERNMRSSLESFTCRGGAWDSSAEECSLDYIPNGNKSEFCVRLVLDY